MSRKELPIWFFDCELQINLRQFSLAIQFVTRSAINFQGGNGNANPSGHLNLETVIFTVSPISAKPSRDTQIMGMAQDILCATWGTVTIKSHYNCNGEIINKPKSWFYLGLQSHCRAWSQANVFPALSCLPYYLRAWNRLLLRGYKISGRVNRIQTMVARIHPIINLLVLS